MAKPRMDLSAFVGKLLEEQDGDVLREGIRVLSQALMETEVAGLIGAERHERSRDRMTYRNGYRTRTWDTRVGTIELQIPKLRTGSYFPSLLQPRRLWRQRQHERRSRRRQLGAHPHARRPVGGRARAEYRWGRRPRRRLQRRGGRPARPRREDGARLPNGRDVPYPAAGGPPGRAGRPPRSPGVTA